MSTVERKPHRRLSAGAPQGAGRRAAAHRPSRRGLFWLAAVLIVGTALLAAAPTLIAVTPLRNVVLSWALADMRGSVNVGGASLGWFSAPGVTDLAIDDADGKPVLRVPSAAGDKSLLGLLFSPKQLGTFQVHQPRVEIIVREGGSNIEDVLHEFLQRPSSGSGSVGLRLEIDGATISIRDQVSGQQWQLAETDLALAVPRLPADPLEVVLAGQVADGATQEPFSLEYKSQDIARSDGAVVAHGTLTAKAASFPLALVQSLVRRAAPGTQLAGRLQADFKGQWGLNAQGQVQRTLAGQAAVRDFRGGGPWLAGEVLRLDKIEAPCQIEWTADVLKVHQLAAVCDAGQLACRATVPEAGRLLTAGTLGEVAAALRRATAEAGGQVDLAMLAQLLPQTLRVRSDTRITSGVATVQWSSKPQAAPDSELAWQGKLETSRLVAIHQGKQLSWDKPLLVTLAGREGSRGVTVERLACESDFLQVEGSGRPDAFRLQGSYDLQRLAAELSKFVDLGGLRLTGQGTTEVGWQRAADGTFEASAGLVVNRFELALAGIPPWTEPELTIDAKATGRMQPDGAVEEIRSGQATLRAGGDQLGATLRATLRHPGRQTVWPLDVQAQGQLGSWLRRALAGQVPPDWEVAGQAQGTAAANLSAEGVEIEKAQLIVQPLKFHGGGLHIDEPSARLVGSGKWSSAQQRLELHEGLLDAPALSAQVRDLVMALGGAAAGETRGVLSFDGDVARLQAWTRDPAAPFEVQLTGHLRGQGTASRTDQKTTASLEATIDNLLATPRGGRQWREPTVKLTAAAVYDHTADNLEISRVDFSSDALQLQAAGKIGQVSSRRDLNLAGQCNYDLDKLTRLLQGYIGQGIRLAGRQSRSFTVSGPLATMTPPGQPVPAMAIAQQLRGRAELGWQFVQAYGFQIGPGVAQAELGDGFLRIAPLEVAAGGGRIRLAPQVRLGPGPAELYLPTGPVLQQIEINREMCATGLMYVAPVLAGVAEAQGRFSMSLDGGRVPLSSPAQGDLGGKLTIHSVEIGPGPLVQELAILLGREAPARLQREAEIPFRMVQGRVYHQNLELIFPDLTIRTHGSVGLDQTLAIMAEMPVPPKWIGNNPLGSALRDQIIRLPIGGTLKQPQIDRVALQQAAAQFLQGAAENAIRNEIGRGLDRLFGPLAPPK